MEMFGGGGSSKGNDDILASLEAQLGSAGNGQLAEEQSGRNSNRVDSGGDDGTTNADAAPLSKKDADDLQRRLDNMSDEQIEKVFSKMRASLGSKMVDNPDGAMKGSVDEIDEAIKAAKLAKTTSNVPSRRLPKTEALDPEIRKKYDRELNAIEEELEKIYNDPLSVWQELIADPDKYLSDEEIKKLDGDQKMQ